MEFHCFGWKCLDFPWDFGGFNCIMDFDGVEASNNWGQHETWWISIMDLGILTNTGVLPHGFMRYMIYPYTIYVWIYSFMVTSLGPTCPNESTCFHCPSETSQYFVQHQSIACEEWDLRETDAKASVDWGNTTSFFFVAVTWHNLTEPDCQIFQWHEQW